MNGIRDRFEDLRYALDDRRREVVIGTSALALLLVATFGWAWLSSRWTPPPSIFDSPVDDVLGYLVTDDFNQLSVEEAENTKKRENECFTTGLRRQELEQDGLAFDRHVDDMHILNYIHFLGYLATKDPSIDSELEAHVRARNADGDCSWIPSLTCWALERGRNLRDGAAEADAEQKRLLTTFIVLVVGIPVRARGLGHLFH